MALPLYIGRVADITLQGLLAAHPTFNTKQDAFALFEMQKSPSKGDVLLEGCIAF